MGLLTRVLFFFSLLLAYLAFSSTLLAWLGQVVYSQKVIGQPDPEQDYYDEYDEYDDEYFYGDDEDEYPHYEL